MSGSHREDLYSISMWYRLLRQHGYAPSQDIFLEFMDKDGKLFLSSQDSNVKGLLELFQASNLHSEEENILKDAKLFSSKYLKKVISAYPDDHELAKQILNTLSLPLHWKVNWFNISKYIYELETENKTNFAALVDLAKLNFNMVQASHQEDLKELSRWWLNLGITAKLSFSRDRLVESFRYAVGIASEPEYGSLRKWLGKIINLILVIDDVYDIYGSLEELVCFSNAVQRWKPEEIEELPECMKICFWALYNTTEDIAVEIQKEKGLNNSVLPYLQKAWGDFCNSLLLEAKWYNKLYFPSVKEYLDNGWTSSSGPLLAIHTILGISNQTTKDISEILQENRDLIYCTSLIIRLCNDQGTSAAELERGDAPSSILCYMREANVSEEEAREYVGNIIMETWERINGNSSGKLLQEPVKMHIINIARAAHFIYQNGDGFGEQEMELGNSPF